MKKKNKNPFEALANFYENTRKENDRLGCTELYKKATENLFGLINYHAYENYIGWSEELVTPSADALLHPTREIFGDAKFYTYEDVQYLDGYFLFASGTNSVVHFHIKELPGWLFGIWWSPVVDEQKTAHRKAFCKKAKPIYKSGKVECEFFAQYEEEIDKFKPSRSEFRQKYTYDDNYDRAKTDYWQAYDIIEMLEFMRDEPDLSYYRDFTGVDFNTKHVTREEASAFCKEKKQWREDNTRIKEEFREFSLNGIKDVFKSLIDSGLAFVQDCGENVSPRYDVIVCNDDIEPGCYGMHENELVDQEKLLAFDNAINEKKLHGGDHYLSDVVSSCIYIVPKDDFDLIKKEEEEK